MAERLRSPLAYRIVIGALAAVAIAAITHFAVATARNGCVFADGDSYCQMARGLDGNAPFSRRVLVPALVGVLPHSWSIAARFEIISVLGALLATFGAFALTLRMVPARSDNAQRRMVAASAAAVLVALSPHFFRLAFGVPILVDLPATGLGVVWCLLLLSKRPWLQVLGALGTVPLILTREAWALPVLAVSLRMLTLRRWKMAAALLGLGAAALGYVSQLPHPNHYPVSGEIRLGWLFLQQHPWSPIWRLMFGLSLVPAMLVLLLRRRNWRWLTEPDYGPALSIVVLIGLCHVVQAPVGGSDVSRIASAALPFLAAAGWAVAARSGAMWPAAGLAVATLAFWQPWHIVGTGADRYDAFFYPPAHEALPNALGLGTASVLVAVAWWSSGRPRQRPPRSAPAEPMRVPSRT